MRPILALLACLPLVAGGTGTLTVKGRKFKAEVASQPEEQANGLMRRAKLAPEACMVFLYPNDGRHPIWMKNCLIALDVAWVDASGKVVEVQERVPPCSPMLGDDCPTFGGKQTSRHFAEFPAGTFKRLGLKVGDRMAFEGKADGQAVKF